MLLLVFLVLFVVSKRPFCRMACPLGLLFSFFNRVSLVKLEVDGGNCDSCDTCQKICPVDIKVYEDPNSPECIRCMKCTSCSHVNVVVPILRPRDTATSKVEASQTEVEIGEHNET